MTDPAAPTPELRWGAATDVGHVRDVNQDAHLAAAPLFAVADGMGGHQAGEVASRVAVEALAELDLTAVEPEDVGGLVTEALRTAQRRLHEHAERERAADERWHSGTTVVAAVACAGPAGPVWAVVNLGDSRAYTLSSGRLEQVTVDHSVVQELVDAGRLDPAEVAHHPERHVITRALGGPDFREPDVFLLAGDDAPRLLLCSDGINGMLDDRDIERVLASEEAADPQAAAERLVAAALEAGGEDNATAVVVDLVP